MHKLRKLKNQNSSPKTFHSSSPQSTYKNIPKLFCFLQNFRICCDFLLGTSATSMQVTLLLKEHTFKH